ncbi:uncharacterized protein LOC119964187 [Scyliorhinus canicula]|uniref:uncharacterized protein LOC119964187 n=1 Tax=Scyliorhinus canicula TaxID=7830 RepID=UPI0018F4C6FA|nr:uncharacterized protein LOC119964187 [Scyliorhinus canicula]XP_038649404.1 uncharacterized protein LOC119964187 [Scyliorhinus canicula]
MVSEINLKTENEKAFCIEGKRASLPVESEIPSHTQQAESSSTGIPATELIPVAPVPCGSETNQKNDNASVGTASEMKVDVADKAQIEAPSILLQSNNVSFNDQDIDCPTNCSKKSGETDASWTFSPDDNIIEPVVGKALGDTNSSQCKTSEQKKEMTQELADTEEFQCCSSWRGCCTTFACGLLAVGMVIFSPLICAWVFLYEIFSCVCKSKDPSPA